MLGEAKKIRRIDRQAAQSKLILALMESFIASGKNAIYVTADAIPVKSLVRVMNNLGTVWDLPARAKLENGKVLLRRTVVKIR